MFRRLLTAGLCATAVGAVSLALATPALADTPPQCSGSVIVCAGVDVSSVLEHLIVLPVLPTPQLPLGG